MFAINCKMSLLTQFAVNISAVMISYWSGRRQGTKVTMQKRDNKSAYTVK